MAIGFRRNSELSCNVIASYEDVILTSVKGDSTNIIVGNIYRSPNQSRCKNTTLRITDILKKYSVKNECLLAGDWNEIPSVITRKFLNKGVQVYTNNAPSKGTRVFQNRKRTKRPIDYGLSTSPVLIQSQITRYNWMLSDHLPVEIKINCVQNSIKNEMNTIFDRKKLYDPKIVETIKNHKYDLNKNSINEISVFHNELNRTLKELKVIRTERKHENQVLIAKSVKREIARKHKTDKLVRKGLASIADLLTARKAVKTAIQVSKRKTYLKFIKEGINYLKANDSRNAWKWVNKQSGRSRYKMVVNQVYKPGTKEPENDKNQILNVWYNHFRNLSISESSIDIQNKIIEENKNVSMITDDHIKWSEIVAALKKMRKGKAAGNDMVPGEVYKLVENEPEPESQLAISIYKMLNNVYNGNEFPIEWKDCAIVPIFKKGDHMDPNNYRGISLINTLLKVITKIIAARLQVVCKGFSLIKREQAGFMECEEGLSQVACLLEACQRRKIIGKDTLICFLDLKKAYDMVPHNRLIYKLQKVGLGNKMISFIKKMYDNTYMQVRINNDLTNSFKYERGVRQGCPTSPLLFNYVYTFYK